MIYSKSKGLSLGQIRAKLIKDSFIGLIGGTVILAIGASMLSFGAIPFMLLSLTFYYPSILMKVLSAVLLAFLLSSILSAWMIAPVTDPSDYGLYHLLTQILSLVLVILVGFILFMLAVLIV